MSYIKNKHIGWQDIMRGAKSWKIWVFMGWYDIKIRYRQSFLGPLWITANMAIMIYSMSFLYSRILKVDLALYLPYLAGGLLTWNLISNIIIDSLGTFKLSKSFILQTQMPLSLYLYRVVFRGFIIFAHNFIAVIPIFIYFHVSTNILGLLFGIVSLYIVSVSVCGIVSIIGTRFNDVSQIINSVMYLCFLMTPILWTIDMIPAQYSYLIQGNPFFHLVCMIRTPLTGQSIPIFSYYYVWVLVLVSFICYVFLLSRTKHRIAYWI